METRLTSRARADAEATVAFSLALYAQIDERFARYLLSNLRHDHEEGAPARKALIIPENARFILPANYSHAVSRYHRLRERGNSPALEILTRWASARSSEDPKAIVIGFVIGVVPPVGMGDIDKKKKLNMVLSKDLGAESDRRTLAKEVNDLTAGIILRALGRAGGSIRKIEPEMHEWIHGDRDIALYEASSEDMERIVLAAEESHALAYVNRTRDAGGTRIRGVSISPSADLSTQEERFGLAPLE